MAFCSKCGNQLKDGAAFCDRCGTARTAAPAAPVASAAPAAAQYRSFTSGMHCPVCKSTNLSPMVGSSYAGMLAADNSCLICSNCGKQFRNIQRVQEDLAANQGATTFSVWMTLLGALVALVLYLLVEDGETILQVVLWPFIAGALVFAVVYLVQIFKYTNAVSRLKEELAYLQQNCF